MSLPVQPDGLAYRPDIDGLRAVAVLAVVFGHAGLGVPGGFVGVDVFFVISGYLITGLILKDLRLGRFSMVGFWERRVRRIMPALAVVVAVCFAAGWLLMLPVDLVGLAKSIGAVGLLSANIYFWRDTGYFAAVAEEKPLLHTWSLAVEEQFYLFLPITLMVLWKLGWRQWLPWLMLFGASASLALGVLMTNWKPDVNFYLLPTRTWELLMGSLLAGFPPVIPVRPRWLREGTALLGIALILWPCFGYSKQTVFPGLTALPPVLGAAMIIWTGQFPGGSLIGRLLSTRPMVFIGLISYSLYLWHWPMMSFARYLSVSKPGPAMMGGLAVASVFLAILTWRFIETPFRKRRFLASRRAVFCGAIASLLAFVGASGLVVSQDGFKSRLPEQAQLLDSTGREMKRSRFEFDYNVKNLPGSFHMLGVAGRSPLVAVWGDSFAMASMPAFDEALQQEGVSGWGITCAAMAPALDYAILTTGPDRSAIARNRTLVDFLIRNPVPNIVLVGSWEAHFRNGGVGFANALEHTVDTLRAAGKKVYFLKDPPSFNYNVHREMVRRSMWKEPLDDVGMSYDDFDMEKIAVNAFLDRVPNAHMERMDPMPCLLDNRSGKFFRPWDDGGSLYSDGYHLSRHGAMKLVPMILESVRNWKVVSAGV